jgi:hypothetical protein
MSALENSTWGTSSKAVAIELPFAVRFEMKSLRKKVDLVGATIAVIGIQLVFRVMIMMRQMNY